MGNKSFYEGFIEKEIKLKNKLFMYRIILFILPISLCQNIIAQKRLTLITGHKLPLE